MSLEQAIYEHWTTFRPLCEQIPAERVFTGVAEGCLVFPYATLVRVCTVSSQRTSCRTIETVEIRLAIWDDNLARGQAAAAMLRERFTAARFAYEGNAVQDVRRVNYVETQQASGAWLLAGDYHFRTSHT